MPSCIPFVKMLVVTGLAALVIGESVSGENPSGLRGKVTDRFNHIPIANAYVVVHRNGVPDVNARTDKEGKYAVALHVGVYDAFIAADFYTPTCRKVQVKPDGMMIFDAALDNNSLGMEID